MKRKTKPRRIGNSAKAKREANEDAFFKHAMQIVEGYECRRKNDHRRRQINRRIKNMNAARQLSTKRFVQIRPPYDQAEGFLKRESYALIQRLVQSDTGSKLIRSIVREYDQAPRYPSYRENPYYWGLIAIDSAHKILGPQRISRYAKQLNYASKNHIAPAQLVGFLYQIRGSVDLQPQLSDGQRDASLNMLIRVEDTQSE